MVISLIMRLMADPVVILIAVRIVALMERMGEVPMPAKMMTTAEERTAEARTEVKMEAVLRGRPGLSGIGCVVMVRSGFALGLMVGLAVIRLLVMMGVGNFVRRDITFIKTLADVFGLRHLLMERAEVRFIAPCLVMMIL